MKTTHRCPIAKGAAACLSLLLAVCLQHPTALADGAEGITLDKTTLAITAGGTAALAASVTLPEGADTSVTWSTGNADIATVVDGTVTAVAAGTADITASVAGGTYTAVCAVTVKSAAIESVLYTVDRTGGCLKGISKVTPASLLFTRLNNTSADLAVLNRDGSAFTGVAVGTGMTLTLTVNGTVMDSLKLIVAGDTNGDGSISISDYTLARLDILGIKALADNYLAAGDVNGDGAITISDYTLMRLDILGIKPIGPEIDLPEVSDARIEAMLQMALAQKGKPYVLGNEGPDSFDCSGLVYYCLNQTGYSVGRSTADTYSKNSKWLYVAKDSLKTGDLLFFYSTDRPGMIGHVAIYLGDGNIVHASSSFGGVTVCPLSGWYWDNLSHARRVFQ